MDVDWPPFGLVVVGFLGLSLFCLSRPAFCLEIEVVVSGALAQYPAARATGALCQLVAFFTDGSLETRRSDTVRPSSW